MGNPAQLGKICKLMSDNNRTVRSGDQSDWISFHKSQKRDGRSFSCLFYFSCPAFLDISGPLFWSRRTTKLDLKCPEKGLEK